MGIYLNPGNDAFKESLNSEIYVDKSGLIEYTNRVLGTSRKKHMCQQAAKIREINGGQYAVCILWARV